MLSRCILDISVGVGAFVIGLSQISSFFLFPYLHRVTDTCITGFEKYFESSSGHTLSFVKILMKYR